jgi:hypothetical protein
MPQSKFLSKASRVLHILALCGFLLPFITVSCGGFTFLEFSGVDLVIGGEPSGMGVEMIKGMEEGFDEAAREMQRELDQELGTAGATTPEPAAEPETKKDGDLSASPEPWAIIALLMILGGVAVAFFLPNRTGLKATIALAAVAFICLGGLYAKAKAEVGDKAKAEINKSTSLGGDADMPGMTSSKKDTKVEVKPGIGMVVTFGLLITILIMAIRALKNERWDEEIATVGPPGGPPWSPPGAGPGSPPPGSPPPGSPPPGSYPPG